MAASVPFLKAVKQIEQLSPLFWATRLSVIILNVIPIFSDPLMSIIIQINQVNSEGNSIRSDLLSSFLDSGGCALGFLSWCRFLGDMSDFLALSREFRLVISRFNFSNRHEKFRYLRKKLFSKFSARQRRNSKIGDQDFLASTLFYQPILVSKYFDLLRSYENCPKH
jgi:hypothetical protein